MTPPTPILTENGYVVKLLQSKEDLEKNYRLRYQVFAETLGWIQKRKDNRDIDEYDECSITIGVFDSIGGLLGSMRLITPPCKFMLETDFRALLPPKYKIRKETDTVEVSRLCMDSKVDFLLARKLFKLLLRATHKLALTIGIRFFYFVVDFRMLRIIRIGGFTCKRIGPIVKLPPSHVESIAAVYDMLEKYDEDILPDSGPFLSGNHKGWLTSNR